MGDGVTAMLCEDIWGEVIERVGMYTPLVTLAATSRWMNRLVHAFIQKHIPLPSLSVGRLMRLHFSVHLDQKSGLRETLWVLERERGRRLYPTHIPYLTIKNWNVSWLPQLVPALRSQKTVEFLWWQYAHMPKTVAQLVHHNMPITPRAMEQILQPNGSPELLAALLPVLTWPALFRFTNTRWVQAWIVRCIQHNFKGGVQWFFMLRERTRLINVESVFLAAAKTNRPDVLFWIFRATPSESLWYEKLVYERALDRVWSMLCHEVHMHLPAQLLLCTAALLNMTPPDQTVGLRWIEHRFPEEFTKDYEFRIFRRRHIYMHGTPTSFLKYVLSIRAPPDGIPVL
jgi:hypothetical protein